MNLRQRRELGVLLGGKITTPQCRASLHDSRCEIPADTVFAEYDDRTIDTCRDTFNNFRPATAAPRLPWRSRASALLAVARSLFKRKA